MHPYHSYNERSIGGYYLNEVPIPMTPLDMSYSQSMLPSGLLMGSPYVQQYPVNMQTGNGRMALANNYPRKYANELNFVPLPFCLLYNGSGMQSTLDQLNVSRTVVLKNLNDELSLHEILDSIDYGPIENCKIFSKPAPNYVKDASSLKVCVISFISSRLSIAFHLNYSKNVSNFNKLKEKLKSKHLQILLNYLNKNTHLSNTGSSHINKLEYIKLRTLNYINDAGATRCFAARFLIRNLKEVDIAELEEDLRMVWSKFGAIEDFTMDLDQELSEADCSAHFISIDVAIQCYEYYLKRMQMDKGWETDDNKEAKVDKAIRYLLLRFERDRCDKTSINFDPSEYVSGPCLQHASQGSGSVGSTSIDSIPEDTSFEYTKDYDDYPDASKDYGEIEQPEEDSGETARAKEGLPFFESSNSLASSLNSLDLTNSSPRFHLNLSSRPRFHSLMGSLPLSASGMSYQYNPDPFNVGNRTIYLGNLHPESTVEEIANNVRAGGLVESIKFHPEKRSCFITFIDPTVAFKFYLNHQVLHLLIIHGYEVHVNWAKHHSGPLPRVIALAVTAGASRNVYIGIRVRRDEEAQNNPDTQQKLPTEEELRKDFSCFGKLEQINFYHDKACVFLNFLNITSAIRLVKEFSLQDVDKINKIAGDNGELYDKYKNFKISFGKDRCGNQPKFTIKKKVSRRNAPIMPEKENILPLDDSESDKQEGEISKEAAMVFGIMSNECSFQDGDGSPVKEMSEETDSQEEKDIKADGTISVAALNKGQVNPKENDLQLNPDMSDPVHEVTESNIEPKESLEDGKNDIEEEYDDLDDISIIINSEDAPPNAKTKRPPRRKAQSYKSRSVDAFLPQANVNQNYGYPYNYFDSSPFTPFAMHSGPQGFPRQGIKYHNDSSVYARSKENMQKNHIVTSGSQVMAQYLARMRQDDLMYTSGAFRDDLNVNDARDFYYKDIKHKTRK